MRVNGREVRSIRPVDDGGGAASVEILDQTRLPHEVRFVQLRDVADTERAIREMWVRGAPLIGVTAAYGIALALRVDASDEALAAAARLLMGTRPTAVNLRWAVEEVVEEVRARPPAERASAALRRAAAMAEADVEMCRAIGGHGLELLQRARADLGVDRPLHILTRCNAGWLATVDWGTALAPVYAAHRAGLPVHVWVSETRPRNQGAGLTAWELGQEGVPYTVVPDNAAGHLLRTGRVDVVLTGTDRTTAAGDVCNKIGTYLKAVAARDCGVPFYAAVPGPSIDWSLGPGEAGRIPIEERDSSEVEKVRGVLDTGDWRAVRIVPAGAAVANFGFDVTPARLVSGLVTDRGVCPASAAGLARLFPEHTDRGERSP